jgi:general stress protein CsbA
MIKLSLLIFPIIIVILKKNTKYTQYITILLYDPEIIFYDPDITFYHQILLFMT